jgi:hypothetical protein
MRHLGKVRPGGKSQHPKPKIQNKKKSGGVVWDLFFGF